MVVEIYRITRAFPKDELYGLTSQIRRAAVSIASNIAEGMARGSQKELAQFLAIAIGSLSEVDTQLWIAVDLGFLKESDPVFSCLEQTSRLLNGFRSKVIKDLR